MTFLVILMALLIERFFDWSHVRSWRWYEALVRSLSSALKQIPPYLIVLLTIIPLAFFVLLIQMSAHRLLYGLVEFIFQLVLFLYCLGPQNLWADVYFSINALAHGEQKQAEDKLNSLYGDQGTSGTHLPSNQLILVWHSALRRVFAIIFWFLIIGPVGAVIYRALELSLHVTSLKQSYVLRKVLAWIDWPAVVILTILFALGGHFVNVFNCWRTLLKSKEDNNQIWLEKCGVAALGPESEQQTDVIQIKQAIQLFDRALIIMLVVFALTVLLR